MAHRAGIVVGPDALRPELRLRTHEFARDHIERFVPRDTRELTRPFRLDAPHGIEQPLRVMHALGVTGDFGADNSRRVGLLLRAMHAADTVRRQHLDIECAARGAIVRTGRAEAGDLDGGVHRALGRPYASPALSPQRECG